MKAKKLFFPVAILLLVWLSYGNHFNNPFHFDDSHTIENNIYIKSLSNIPLFFKDATTFSSLPTNQTYRPVVTTSLAIDYALGKGLNPFYFHINMFLVFILQLFLMYFLYNTLFKKSQQHKRNIFFAFFAVLWYGVHTVNAETINYIISRSDLYSAFFVTASMVMYIAFPRLRKWMLYLIPAALGMFAKEQTVMFAPILFVYIALYEEDMSLGDLFRRKHIGKVLKAFGKSLPAFIVCGLLAVFVIKMQTKTFTPGHISIIDYLITQPWVMLRYFVAFFLPFNLSADSDWKVISNVFDERVIVGFVFIILLIYTAFRTSIKRSGRPVSMGIAWFILALLPTSSIIPLSEVTNDHRMFFPFIGLMMAVVWQASQYVLTYEKRIKKTLPLKVLIGVIITVILAGNIYGVRQRNKVWSSDENLWLDVTKKSPANGRGLMNYGLALMQKGDFKNSLDYYNRALVYLPYYPYLQVNLGVVTNAMGNPTEAEAHFIKATQLGPNFNETFFFYARYLFSYQRYNEAMINAEKSLSLSSAHLPTRHLLLDIYVSLRDKTKLDKLIEETLNIFPGDEHTKSFIGINLDGQIIGSVDLKGEEDKAKAENTPEAYLNLSLLYYNQQAYEKCIDACYKALELKPLYAEAYNNICSAYNAMGEWEKAVDACEQSLNIRTDYTLAKNNLKYAKSQLK